MEIQEPPLAEVDPDWDVQSGPNAETDDPQRDPEVQDSRERRGIRSIGYRISKVTLFDSVKSNPMEPRDNTIPNSADTHESGPLLANDIDFETDDQNKLFVSMLIMLIFSEALAL